MLKIFLNTPGILFRLLNGESVRTPFVITIGEKDRLVYESRIRASAVTDFEIVDTEPEDNNPPSKVPKRPSVLKKPASGKGINLKTNISPTNLT